MIGDWASLKKDPEKNSRGVALSKGLLLQGILKEAQSFGVEYFPNTNVTGVSQVDGGAVVESKTGDFEGRFVVAADGINSRIVRSLGLNKSRKFLGTSRSLCWVMSGVRPPDPEGHIFIFTMYGTFSIMPVCHEDHFHVCVICDDSNTKLDELLEQFTRNDPVFQKWFAGAKREKGTESSIANAWEAIEKPYSNNVIIVGDACWCEQFANPPALSSGHQVGCALIKAFIDESFNEEGVAQYLQWYDTHCFQPFGRQPMGGGISLTDFLTAEELDYLASLPEKPAPHTASFLKMFKTIIETYQPLAPRIQEEKPEILEKMK
ncbi:MAG: FAD-dependent monooxygenase, partial [Desulfatiglandales bacterium]|nr:FAD-dependent monooxygenase [Desulfatiglandales bacterium]